MHSESLQIYWHDSHPIYSLTFQPLSDTCQNGRRLVTAGGDNKVRVWNLNFDGDKIESLDFLSSLTQHEQAVNVCRFNKSGDILATAGDDGMLFLWKKNDTMVKEFGVDDDEFADFKETWAVWKRLRSGSASNAEIYDLCWSPCGENIATASLDNTIRIYDINDGKVIAHLTEHSHYVQGITWDPQGDFLISQSADRSVIISNIIYENSKIVGIKMVNKILKSELPRRITNDSRKLDHQNSRIGFLFHNETLPSFFRRLTMSPCGNLLCLPAGIFRNDESTGSINNPEFLNAVYIYTRGALRSGSNKPILSLPFLEKPALVIKFNPNGYALTEDKATWIDLPYRLVFAVATSSEVMIYDTQDTKPLAIIGNLHYTPITDLAWSEDGKLLMISSTDGFCSYVNLKDALGAFYGLSLLNPSKSNNAAVYSKAQRNAELSRSPSRKPALSPKRTLDEYSPKQAKKSRPENKSDDDAGSKPKRRVQPVLLTESEEQGPNS